MFFLFCSHAILFYFGGMIFRPFFGNYGSELFPITFFTLPLLAVVVAVIGLPIINRSRLMLFLSTLNTEWNRCECRGLAFPFRTAELSEKRPCQGLYVATFLPVSRHNRLIG